jgi:hypothetical protein
MTHCYHRVEEPSRAQPWLFDDKLQRWRNESDTIVSYLTVLTRYLPKCAGRNPRKRPEE